MGGVEEGGEYRREGVVTPDSRSGTAAPGPDCSCSCSLQWEVVTPSLATWTTNSVKFCGNTTGYCIYEELRLDSW